MGRRPKSALRPLSEGERRELQRVAKASSERLDAVKRARALLAVADCKTLTQAGESADLSREGVSQLVERFNQRGLAVLVIAAGRGRKPTYKAEQRARVVQEAQRPPDRKEDQTATWSLKLLQRALRRAELPRIGPRPLDASCMRKATACSATAPGVKPGPPIACAKTASTVCAIRRRRKKKCDRAGLSDSRGLWTGSVVSG
jgi:transposase